jgi:hypothetical protein
MSEDSHLCLLAGGWKGLLNFLQQRLLTNEAVISCTNIVESTGLNSRSKGVKIQSDEDTILLNKLYIYDFPDICLTL